jgi:hypothetical protein
VSFTPGPLRCERFVTIARGETHEVYVIRAPDGSPVASLEGPRWHDACLLTCAPELYAALEACAAELAGYDFDAGATTPQPALVQARAALARARGEAV